MSIKKYYSVQETAKLLGVQAPAIRARIRSNKIRAERVGGVLVVAEDNLREALEREYRGLVPQTLHTGS
jgi:excisionase family DNA binding protein